MAMFKDIKKKLTEAGQNAVSQTKKLAETADLNAKINKKQGDLNKELLELGKQFYLNKKNSVPKAFAEQFEAINGIREDIAQMKDRIAGLKESVETPATEETVAVPEAAPEPAPEPAEPAKKTAEKKPTAAKKPTAKKPVPKKTAEKKPAAKKPVVNKEFTIPTFEASGRNCTNCGKPLGEDETVCPGCGTENPAK